MSKKTVCIIMPAYNEATVIGEVIKTTKQLLGHSDFEFEILVVDDKSSDLTAKIAHEAGATVITHLLNHGAGGATSTGLRYAQIHNFDIAATMDADGQHDPVDLLNCISNAVKIESDLLIGSRLVDSHGMSRVKIIGNKGLSVATWLLFGVSGITDSQSGLRIFSRKALGVLEWRSTGYEFCSEMIWRAKQANLLIAEHPIKAIYTEYSRQKGQNNWNGINIIKSLIKQRVAEMFE